MPVQLRLVRAGSEGWIWAAGTSLSPSGGATAAGVVRRLVAATADFGLVAGQREWPDGSVQAVVLEPLP